MNTPTARQPLTWVLRSEWSKLWSLRSTTYSLLLLAALTVAVSVLFCWGSAANIDDFTPQQRRTFDPTEVSLAGLVLGQLGAAVLGVLVVSSEYTTGAVRSTFTAVPRRLDVLVAKTILVTAVAGIVGAATCMVSYLLGQLVLSTEGLESSLGDPQVLRAVIGGGLYLAASAMFGAALGVVLRQTAAAVVVAVAALLVLPQLAKLLPGSTGTSVSAWLTSNAGKQITAVHRDLDAAGPWAGYGAFCLWGLVTLAVGAVLLVRRDA